MTLWLVLLMGALAVLDVKTRRIPNWAVAIGSIIGIVGTGHIIEPALMLFTAAMLVAWPWAFEKPVYPLFAFYAPGDAKLMVMLASFIGWWAFLVLGISVLTVLAVRLKHNIGLPFAPFVFASYILVLMVQ